MKTFRPVVIAALLAAFQIFAFAAPALASPGSGAPGENFGWNLIHYASAVLGPIVFLLGLVGSALVYMSRGTGEGIQKMIGVLIGGLILFSLEPILHFVQGAL